MKSASAYSCVRSVRSVIITTCHTHRETERDRNAAVCSVPFSRAWTRERRERSGVLPAALLAELEDVVRVVNRHRRGREATLQPHRRQSGPAALHKVKIKPC